MSAAPPGDPLSSTDETEPVARQLGPLVAFSVVAGSMLGVGIFLMPPRSAQLLEAPWTYYALWLSGGVIAFAGAAACAELGAMLPKSGGDYVFHREAFGPSVAFATGWVLFAAVFSGSVASLAVAVFHYQVGPLLGVDLSAPVGAGLSGAQLCALGLIALITLLNDRSVTLSGRLQSAVTVSALSLLAISALVFLATSGAPTPLAADALADPPHPRGSAAAIVTVFLLVNFAYSGWINVMYVAGEVKEPARTIPRAMIAAVGAITALYLLLCFAFATVLGFDRLASLGATWTDAGTGMAGYLGLGWLESSVHVVIICVMVTSMNATVLGGSRLAYVMATDGAFWSPIGALHPTRRVPQRALWMQASLASALVLSGTFDQVVEMTSIAMLVTGTLTVTSVFVLRRTRPALPRPHRTIGYPVIPAIYIVSSVAVIVFELVGLRRGEGASWLPLFGVGVFVVMAVGHRLARRA